MPRYLSTVRSTIEGMRWCLLLCASTALFLNAQSSSIASRMQDLNFVATQLPNLDPNFFSNLPRTEFQQAVNDLQATLSTLTDAQFYVGLAQLVAMPGDAHTYLYLGNAPGFQTLPLHLRWLGDGVFVTSAGPEYTAALGTRLIAVGGLPIDDVIGRLGTVIPHENDQWLHYGAQTYLLQQQTLEGLGIIPEGSPAQMTFQNLDGSEFSLALTASNEPRTSLLSAATGSIPDYLSNTSANYWFTYSAANRMLYFKYNVCANDPSNPFSTFAATLLSTVDSNPVDNLVFDFRGNTGGDDSVINPLLNGIAQRLPRLTTNLNFVLYVAIDEGTFSSGMDDAEVFKEPGLGAPVRVIGEPTGGKPAHFGNVASFTLPGSQTPGQYSQQFISAPSYIPNGDPSFEPDIPIAIRSTDYFARFDPVMAAILARSQGAPPTPTGGVTTVNGASYRTDQGIAPGSIAIAFGAFSNVPDGVLVSGIASQVLAASTAQVNFIVPETVPLGTAAISVRAAGSEIASGTLTVSAAGPGIFVLQPADPQQPGAIEDQDSGVNDASHPAAPGTATQIYATGFGGDGVPVQIFFGDTPAQVLYSGSAGPGLWQINAVVPNGLSGRTPVFLISGGLASNAVTMAVH
jgi:uncharacterized protein (TIGR03437 family)